MTAREPLRLEWLDEGAEYSRALVRDSASDFCVATLTIQWDHEANTYVWAVKDGDCDGPSGSERTEYYAKVVAEAKLFDLLDDAITRLGGIVEREPAKET